MQLLIRWGPVRLLEVIFSNFMKKKIRISSHSNLGINLIQVLEYSSTFYARCMLCFSISFKLKGLFH